MKKILLVSNTVMHYRAAVYNYFAHRFREEGCELLVRANRLQKENPHPLDFDFAEVPFSFPLYRSETRKIDPAAVILFLHMKDRMLWPYLHWLKLSRYPVIFWTKGANLDAPNSRVRNALFGYLHSLSDGIILYSEHELPFIHERNRGKVSIAPNTLNFESFPAIAESKEQIKRELGINFEKVVLFVGRMGVAGGRKKVDHLVEVFRRIGNPGWGLIIVGSGMSEETRSRLNPGNTRYLGEIHDPEERIVSRLFKMADLFCIPGHIGLGINQAFYWGLPVVTEAGGQPPEVHYLVDGRNGFLVPENDLDSLQRRLTELLEQESLRKEMSRNAMEDIREKASTERMYQGFREAVGRVGRSLETAGATV